MSTFELLETYISLRREVALLRASETKDLEFGHNQISILYRLSISGATMGELADHSFSDKASVSRTVASLERAGYVNRVVDASDRRIVNIELTPKGRTLAKKAQEIRSSIGERLNSALSPADREQLVTLMQKLIENLKTQKS